MLFKEHLENTYIMNWAFLDYLFHKIVNILAPKYLTNYKNTIDNLFHKTRASEHNSIKRFGTRTENFKQSFFPYCVNEWYKLDISLRKSKNIKCFKSVLQDFFNLKKKSLFVIHVPAVVKLVIIKVTVKA